MYVMAYHGFRGPVPYSIFAGVGLATIASGWPLADRITARRRAREAVNEPQRVAEKPVTPTPEQPAPGPTFTSRSFDYVVGPDGVVSAPDVDLGGPSFGR